MSSFHSFLEVSKEPSREVPQLTKEEKKLLGQKIRRLPQIYMRGIITIVSKEQQAQGGTIEFDISKLKPETNRELMAYVDNCLKAEQEKKEANPQNPGNGFPSNASGN